MEENLKDCSPVHDVICRLLEEPFSTWKKSDQIQLVNVDRPQATISSAKRNFDGSLKKSNTDLYCKYDWICSSTFFQILHCWPCLLFAKKSEKWAYDLCYDERDYDMLEKHVKEESHIISVFKLADFKLQKCQNKVAILRKSKTIPLLEKMASKYEVELNKKCAYLAVDAILFMVQKQMHLANNDDSSSSNYSDLLLLLMSQSQDEELQSHFRKRKGYVKSIWTESTLQSVIENVSNCILEQIRVAVQMADFFSLRIDDGLNESSECALFIRIVNPNYELTEFFLGYYSLGSDKTSLSLFKILNRVLEKYEYKFKLIGICFDITCVKFNCLKELHVGMKSLAKQSINANLFGHCLDYMVEKCLNRIPTCRQFFSNLNEILNLSKVLVKRNSCPNSEYWSEVSSMKNTCCSKFKLLSAMIQDWIEILNFFQEIQQKSGDLEDVHCLVFGICAKLKEDQFVFLAVLLCHIFMMTNTLYQELIFNPFDPVYCQERVFLTLARRRKDTCYEAIAKQADQILRECNGGDDFKESIVANSLYKSLFYEILDSLIIELQGRFDKTDKHTYFQLGNFFRSSNKGSLRAYQDAKDYVRDRVKVVKNYYPNLFKETAELEDELTRLNYVHGSSKKPLLNLIYELKFKCVEENSFENIYKLMNLITLQTSSTLKFPCLHEFSNYLNDSDISLRPYLANILMNKQILDDLSSISSFKDDILSKLSINYNVIKQSITGKSLEKQPDVVVHRSKQRLLLKKSNLQTTTATPSDSLIVSHSTARFTFVPGPSTQTEPDSSTMEQSVHLAVKSEVYSAEQPQHISETKIKEEPRDHDETCKQDIIAASTINELRYSLKEHSSTNDQNFLFQLPVLIKEEPVSIENET